MSRTLTAFVLLSIAATNLLGQTTADPIAKMTSDIVRQYTGTSRFNRSMATDRRQLDLQDEAMLPSTLPKATTLPRASSWSLPFRFSLPWLTPERPESMPEGLRLDQDPTPSLLPLPNVQARAFDFPRPLALSTASSNGIHAVDAIVATEEGEEHVELKGTRAQLRRQLKSFSPQAQSVMKRSLGL